MRLVSSSLSFRFFRGKCIAITEGRDAIGPRPRKLLFSESNHCLCDTYENVERIKPREVLIAATNDVVLFDKADWGRGYITRTIGLVKVEMDNSQDNGRLAMCQNMVYTDDRKYVPICDHGDKFSFIMPESSVNLRVPFMARDYHGIVEPQFRIERVGNDTYYNNVLLLWYLVDGGYFSVRHSVIVSNDETHCKILKWFSLMSRCFSDMGDGFLSLVSPFYGYRFKFNAFPFNVCERVGIEILSNTIRDRSLVKGKMCSTFVSNDYHYDCSVCEPEFIDVLDSDCRFVEQVLWESPFTGKLEIFPFCSPSNVVLIDNIWTFANMPATYDKVGDEVFIKDGGICDVWLKLTAEVPPKIDRTELIALETWAEFWERDELHSPDYLDLECFPGADDFCGCEYQGQEEDELMSDGLDALWGYTYNQSWEDADETIIREEIHDLNDYWLTHKGTTKISARERCENLPM